MISVSVMNPLLILSILIAVMLLFMARRVNIGVSMIVVALIMGLMTLAPGDLVRSAENTLTSWDLYRLIILVSLAIALSRAMELNGMLEIITDAFSSLNPQMSMYAIPMLIGLVPMPGGAMVSALMTKEVFSKERIGWDLATFINYWFRHVWIPVWPLYQGLIFSMIIFEVGVTELVSMGWSITLGAVTAGLLVSAWKVGRSGLGELKLREFLFLWPIVLLAVMILVLHLDLALALALTLIAVVIARRPKSWGKILRDSLDPTVILLMVGVMLFKGFSYASNFPKLFYSQMISMGADMRVVSFMLPLTIGLLTGAEMNFVSIAFPMLVSYVGVGSSFVGSRYLIAMAGGILGVLLSPMHLCLVLTSKVYGVHVADAYRYLIPASVIMISIVLLFYLL